MAKIAKVVAQDRAEQREFGDAPTAAKVVKLIDGDVYAHFFAVSVNTVFGCIVIV